MSRCDRDVLDELNRWRFTTVCQEFIEQGIFDYGCAKHFAEWQKKQDQETIELAEDHAMLAGMNKMEQQMMEKAVETQILTTSFINLPKEYLHQNGIQAGDKVRVIVIPNTDEK